MSEVQPASEGGARVMRLRYRGVCEVCGAELAAGVTAVYDRTRRKVRCVECPTTVTSAPAPVDPAAVAPQVAPAAAGDGEAGPGPAVGQPAPVEAGTAGGSAQRIYDRKAARDRARQEARVAEDRAWRERARAEHPALGRIASAVTPKEVIGPEPQHVTAWRTGAEGEQKVGQRLDRWAAAGGGIVLHDRRQPGTRANIDHLAVTASGVWVIDAKHYEGKVEVVDVGGWLRTDIRLKVAGRDRTRLTEGVAGQVAAVTTALATAWPGEVRPTVRGVLCFTGAHWGWLAKPSRVNDIVVAWTDATIDILDRPGPWTTDEIGAIGAALASVLRPA